MAAIKITWHSISGGRFAVAHWLHDGRLIMELTDYSIYLSRQRSLDPLTVDSVVYDLVRFVVYCYESGIALSLCDDIKLLQFRGYKFDRLRERVGNLGSDKTQKRTVNRRLTSVYGFLVWYQAVNYSISGLIGNFGCQIRSSLPLEQTSNTRYTSRKLRYPLHFSLSGSASKHRPVKAASSGSMEALTRIFSGMSDDFLAARNILIIDIADTVGLRRASINSLTCSQFLLALQYEEAIVDLEIVPSSQKFGYQFSYIFPYQLVSSILQYIEGPRKALLERLGVSAIVSADRLFLSGKTGLPLDNRSITRLIGSTMRSIGINKGSIHTFRHKFVNDEVEREIMRRVELGLDTSIESIASAVSLRVGQTNPNSLYTYVSHGFARLNKLIPIDDKQKIKRLEREIDKLTKDLDLIRERERMP